MSERFRQASVAQGDLAYAPPSFTNAAGERVVFVDFTEAEYDLEFDTRGRTAVANSTIRFESDEEGHPALCLWQPVSSATLDGELIDIRTERAPDGAVEFRSLSRSVPRGTYTLSVRSDLSESGPRGDSPVLWLAGPDRLHCLFDMSDLSRDGRFLDAYLPSNYEYDHFRMTFRARVVNSPAEHHVFTNGAVTGIGRNEWRIEFPPHFTTSSPWLHLGAADEYRLLTSTFSSRDGRALPVLVYTTTYLTDLSLETFRDATLAALSSLESDFGSFPHPSVTVFATGNGNGGMEYAGATTSELAVLRHELDHSYFARCVTPANGDAGWIDEAIAQWGDAGYPRSPTRPARGANMGARSPYIRATDGTAYTIGRDFLAHLDHVLRDRGGLKRFLAGYAVQKRHASVTAAEFQRLVEGFLGASLAELFERHIYGPRPAEARAAPPPEEATYPHAPKARLIDVMFPRQRR